MAKFTVDLRRLAMRDLAAMIRNLPTNPIPKPNILISNWVLKLVSELEDEPDKKGKALVYSHRVPIWAIRCSPLTALYLIDRKAAKVEIARLYDANTCPPWLNSLFAGPTGP